MEQALTKQTAGQVAVNGEFKLAATQHLGALKTIHKKLLFSLVPAAEEAPVTTAAAMSRSATVTVVAKAETLQVSARII